MSWWSTACKFLLKSIPIKCLSSCLCPSNDNIRFESQSKCSQELCCPESWCMLLDSGHSWWRRLRMQNEEQSIVTLSLRDGLLRLSPDKDLGIYFKCYQHIYMGIYFQAFLMLSIMWAVHPQNWQKFAWSKLVWEHSLSQWWVWESQHQSLWGYLNLSCFFFLFFICSGLRREFSQKYLISRMFFAAPCRISGSATEGCFKWVREEEKHGLLLLGALIFSGVV